MILINTSQNASTYGGASNAYTFRLEVILENNNTITINHYAKPNSNWGYNQFSTPRSYIYLNNSLKKETVVSSISPYSSEKLIGTWNGTSDTANISVRVEFRPNTSSYSYLPATNSISGTAVLPGSTITCNDSADMNSTLAITVTQINSSYSHILYYKAYDGTYTEIGRYAGTHTHSWTVADMASYYPNDNQVSYELKCDTYLNGTYTGTPIDSYKTFMAVVPSSYDPTVTIDSVAENNSNIPSGFPYIQGYSKLRVTTTFTGRGNATPVSRTVSYNGMTATSTSTANTVVFSISQAVTTSGNLTITVTATDSRGRTATATQTINILRYTPPSLEVDCTRCDSAGNIDAMGDYVLVLARWQMTPILQGSTPLNYYTIEVFLNGTSSADVQGSVASQTTWTQIAKLGTVPITSQATIEVTIKDRVETNPSTVTQIVSKATVPISFYDDGTNQGVDVGQMATEGGFRVHMDMHLFEGQKIIIHKADNTTEQHDVTELFS